MPAGGSPWKQSPAASPEAAIQRGQPNHDRNQARIGHQLRAMYDESSKQGVPDRFAAR